MQGSLILRFRLKIGSAAYYTAHPIPDKTWKIQTATDPGEMYFRPKFSGSLIFHGADYDAINSAAFDTEFRILVQEQVGATFQSIQPVLRFYKTDCDFDADKSQVRVTPQNVDAYREILAGMNKEFNLIDLAPPTVTVNYRKQGVLQVYLPGSEYIMNYQDGLFWEIPVTVFQTTPQNDGTIDFANHLAMLNDYGFGQGTNGVTEDYARLVISGNGLNPDVSGVYKSSVYGDNGAATPISYEREDGVYLIDSYTSSPGNTKIRIKRASDSVSVYESEEHPSGWWIVGQPPHTTPNVTFRSLTSTSTCQAYGFYPYVRLLTTKTTVLGNATTLLPDDDPFSKGVFTHALPIDTLNFKYSAAASTTPTRWGKVSNDSLYFGGQYFTKPTGQNYMPLLQTTWTAASAWFYLDSDLRDLMQDAGEDVTCKDAYLVSDVIKSLLAAVGTNALHGNTSSFSEFFYGSAANDIRGVPKYAIIVPKSNILNGNYQTPAKKAMIRLSEVLQLLRNFHNTYWYVTGENKFRLEHYQYFHDGNSYAGANVGTSLLGLINPQANLPWSHGTAKWQYEKQDLPERYEFGWMDDVSAPFEGYPININSGYVDKGKVEDKKISRFTSDIDYLHVSSSSVSTEGFVFLECSINEVSYDVPFVDITVSADETYRLQNGWASFLYAHENYWRHGLPATDVNLNGQDITATSVLRTKTQTVEIPRIANFDHYELVESSLGDGRIESSEFDLESGFRAMKIRLDN